MTTTIGECPSKPIAQSRQAGSTLQGETTRGAVRHRPIRMCVVCRQTSDKKTLLRVVRRTVKTDESGPTASAGATHSSAQEVREVRYDRSGKMNGRGAYVCASKECIDKAIKQKRFERSLNVASIPDTLGIELRAAAEQADLAGVTGL